VERKRPGVGKPVVLPGVGIADCRGFPGVVDIDKGYMSSGRLTLSDVVIIAVYPSRASCHRLAKGTYGYSV